MGLFNVVLLIVLQTLTFPLRTWSNLKQKWQD